MKHDNETESLKEEEGDKKRKIVGNWTIGLVFAILITMILSVIATVATMKLCCN